MSHTNYRRQNFRKPVPRKPNKIITPDNVYDRKREKEKLRDIVKKYGTP